jgi:SAM-dependent methyltransferase
MGNTFERTEVTNQRAPGAPGVSVLMLAVVTGRWPDGLNSLKLKTEINRKNYSEVFNQIELMKELLELATQNRRSNNTNVLEYNYLQLQEYYIENFSHAIVTEKAIIKIKDFLHNKKCKLLLEIGSGFGLWAALINLSINNKKENVVNVIATDINRYPDKYYRTGDNLYYDVKKLDYKSAIEDYSDTNSCLFLCWPPYNKDVASESLKLFKGNYLIFIGDGNVANPEFFEILDKDWNGVSPENWKLNPKNYFEIPRWYNREDRLYFYERKSPKEEETKADGKSKRRQSSKRKSKRRQSSKRKSKRRQSSKRKSKRYS